jgi:hypothetical protein
MRDMRDTFIKILSFFDAYCVVRRRFSAFCRGGFGRRACSLLPDGATGSASPLLPLSTRRSPSPWVTTPFLLRTGPVDRRLSSFQGGKKFRLVIRSPCHQTGPLGRLLPHAGRCLFLLVLWVAGPGPVGRRSSFLSLDGAPTPFLLPFAGRGPVDRSSSLLPDRVPWGVLPSRPYGTPWDAAPPPFHRTGPAGRRASSSLQARAQWAAARRITLTGDGHRFRNNLEGRPRKPKT